MTQIVSLGMAVALLTVMATASYPQTTLKEIEDGLSEKTGELERVDKLLADPDRNRRVSAMQALLNSGEPVYISRAKEVGLFSSDTEMREAALKAIFDAGGPFRLVLDLKAKPDEKDAGRQWSIKYGNVSADGATGSYSFGTEPFDKTERCWKFQNYNSCALYLSGTTISLVWPTGKGSLKLSTDGVMSGSFIANGATIATSVKIPLIE